MGESMGVLRFPGLVTGIDTAALIKQLMIINSRRLASYQVQKTGYEEQNTALDALRTTISTLESAANALSDTDDLDIFSTSSSDTDILTASASSSAETGSHSIEINQLATAETWIQDTSTFDYETDYVLTDDSNGVFIYSYNNVERTITAVKNETTLEDLVGLINNDEENPGVTASLLYQGGKYHLMLSGQQTGEDYQISFNASSTEVWKPDTGQSDHTFTDDSVSAGLTTKITELDQFSGPLEGGEKIEITGKNHFGTDLPDSELIITENTTVGHIIDAINEHFDGVATARLENGQIWLTDHMSGTSLLDIDLTYNAGGSSATLGLPTMAVSTEGGGTLESLPSLVSTSFIETQSAQNSQITVDGYPSSTAQELQTLTTDAAATNGTFTLSFRGETTSALDYTATIGDIESALDGLTTISAVGGVTVTGSDLTTGGGADLDIEFLASAGDVEMISIDKGSLVGPTTFEIIEDTKGNDGWLHRNSNSVYNTKS
ncbi:MAG: flagellar cap protein FliD N-terminal domain-containing protein [Planctomycetota bacterium]|jgi:flagellar capping protein FliD